MLLPLFLMAGGMKAYFLACDGMRARLLARRVRALRLAAVGG